MKRCKVLFVTRWYPTPQEPWRGTFVQDWARVAARIANVEVLHLMSGGPGTLREEPGFDDGVRVHGLPIARRGFRAPVQHCRDQWAAAAAIEQLHRQRDFDLLHAHAYIAATAARLGGRRCNIPYIVTEHFTRLLSGNGNWFHLLEARFAYREAARVTAVGPALQDAVRRITRSPVDILPNPVPAVFTLEPRRRNGMPFRLLSLGRLERVKGYDVGLDALSTLRPTIDFRWIIGGDGSERANLEGQVARLGLADRVEFMGQIDRHEVHQQLRRADAVLVPSRVETFSMVAAEALMTGRPVIATRSGGPEAYIGPEEGRVAPVENAAALGEAIEEVLLNLSAFPPSRVAEAARARFSEEAVAARLAAMYREVDGCN